MINLIHLINFGPHKDLKLELSPRVNVIVGENDTGKTSIFRALDWVINNNPSGANFLNNDCNEKEVFSVTVETPEATTTRERSKTKNEYCLSTEKDLLTNFGTGVPEKVAKILKFSDINFQYQMDDPFLLLSTSGEVSRYLNKTIDLDAIDIAFENIGKMKRNANKNFKKTDEDLKKIEKELLEYKDLDSFEKQYNSIIELQEACSEIEFNLDTITALLPKLSSIEAEIDLTNKIIKKEKEVNEILELSNENDERYSNILALDCLMENLENLQEKINDIDLIVQKESEIKEIINEIKLAEESFQRLTKSTFLLEKIDTLVDEIRKTSVLLNKEKDIVELERLAKEEAKEEADIEILTSLLNEIQVLEDEIKEGTKSMKSDDIAYKKLMRGKCPLCEQEIKK